MCNRIIYFSFWGICYITLDGKQKENTKIGEKKRTHTHREPGNNRNKIEKILLKCPGLEQQPNCYEPVAKKYHKFGSSGNQMGESKQEHKWPMFFISMSRIAATCRQFRSHIACGTDGGYLAT